LAVVNVGVDIDVGAVSESAQNDTGANMLGESAAIGDSREDNRRATVGFGN
jgi:hypothetical protein